MQGGTSLHLKEVEICLKKTEKIVKVMRKLS